MVALTVIGFYVVQWHAAIWVKHLFIVVAALAVTIRRCDVLIRWSNVARFLFGLKPRTVQARCGQAGRADRALHKPIARTG